MNETWSYQKSDQATTRIIQHSSISTRISPPSYGNNHGSIQNGISRKSIIFEETRLLLNLAIPTIIIHCGITFPPFLIASYVGRVFGPVYLGGFQLASLTGNIFTLSILEGLYSASDTLAPQAFGAGNLRHVGVITIQGFLGSLLIMIPTNAIIMPAMQPVLTHLGEDSESSHQASRWYKIYALSLPFYALYMVTWKFLSAQDVMLPLVFVCIVNCLIVFPLALMLCTYCFGFVGSAISVVVFQVSQSGLLLAYLKAFSPHSSETWPGLRDLWDDIWDRKAFKTYFYLGLGGIVASSEWIYWETITLIVGKLGLISLSVQAIATQVLSVIFMIPLGVGIGLAIRLGNTLPINVPRAKMLTVSTFLVSTLLFGCMALAAFTFRETIFSIFTNDPAVITNCDRIWWKVCFYIFHLSVFALLMGIAIGLGMQWTLGVTTFVVLWLVALPGAWYFGVVRAHDLGTVWNWIYPPYIVINLALLCSFVTSDWFLISHNIRVREGVESPDYQENENNVDEQTRMLQTSEYRT